ncbi:3-oxoacyl-[acyl-carrier protein] reductase [Roseomonas rosea]|uniref:3-oxoacyl-[acyl-carrier protein] reductase n=1 Tax=Muricoccus roseus TaxID=198092 RepID=A0A1M6LTI2_9PROT|nr:SDR family oxidoreductase [Roseomonas rosea]SHJ74372.1 3-oxoacyl-[acyl-carrier protein] reductase [Roseomonas rosea]
MSGALEGRRAIVTGSSAGIGLAIARLFLDSGAVVIGADREPPPDSLATHPRFRALVADLAAPGAGEAVVEACRAAGGAPQVLVNNAGIGDARPILETDDAALQRYLSVNLAAPFALCRAAIRAMVAAGEGGSIINMASAFGLVGAARSSGYAPTKAALIGLTLQLATEYGRHGIRVNAVAPGLIETALTRERLAGNAWFRRMMIENCPLGRPGRAEEVARACRFLASDEAAFVTGVVLPVDGGWSSAKFMPEPAGEGA